jgi:hypothetical protein
MGPDWCAMLSCFLFLNLAGFLLLWPIAWLLERNSATRTPPGPVSVREPIRKASSSMTLLGCCVLFLVPSGWSLGFLVGSISQLSSSGGLHRAGEFALVGALVGFLFSFLLYAVLAPSSAPRESSGDSSLPSPGPRWREREEEKSPHSTSEGIQPVQDDTSEGLQEGN